MDLERRGERGRNEGQGNERTIRDEDRIRV